MNRVEREITEGLADLVERGVIGEPISEEERAHRETVNNFMNELFGVKPNEQEVIAGLEERIAALESRLADEQETADEQEPPTPPC